MRKACIELNGTLKCASLFSGDLGMGKCLHNIYLSNEDLSYDPTPQEWLTALNACYQKADELKYEVSRVRGRSHAALVAEE